MRRSRATRAASAVALLLVLVAGTTGEEKVRARWNRSDLSQFGEASVGFEVLDGEIRGSGGGDDEARPRLRIPVEPLERPGIRLGLVGSCAGVEFHAGHGVDSSFLIVRGVPTPHEETDVGIAWGDGFVRVTIDGRNYAAVDPVGDVEWIEIRLDRTGFVRLRDVVWTGSPKASETPSSPGTPPPEEPEKPETETPVAGTLEGRRTWSGTVRLAGDVLVPRGATVRIEPGTKILPAEIPGPSDPQASFYEKRSDLLEIHVLGRIEALGAERSPILFGTEAPVRRGRREPVWFGIVLHPGRDRESRFSHCVFRGALGGIQTGDGRPAVEDCVFLGCSLGVGAGTIVSHPREARFEYADEPAPQIRRCRFGNCDCGVYVDVRGRPLVERSVFFRCETAIGAWPGINLPITGLGAIVERSDFLSNSLAVEGSSSVSDSIFLGNLQVFRSSAFHSRCASIIDRYHRSGNVYADNRVFADTDVPAGAGASFVAPAFRGPLPSSDGSLLSADLPRALSLTEASPVRGKAGDGGDPGAFGRAGPKSATLWEGGPAVGDPLLEWVAPGPPDAVTTEVLPRRERDVPRPGDLFRDVVWCRMRASEDGVLRLSFPDPAAVPEILLATGVECRRAGCVRLRLGVDGRFLEASWNGTAIECPAGRRRFARDDVDVELPVEKGENRLVLRLHPDRPVARVGARIVPAADLVADDLYALADPERDRKPVHVERVVGVARHSDEGYVLLHLDGSAHWADATDPRAFELCDESGHRLEGYGVEYLPGHRVRIRLTGLDLSHGGAYRLRILCLRDAWGLPLEGEREFEFSVR